MKRWSMMVIKKGIKRAAGAVLAVSMIMSTGIQSFSAVSSPVCDEAMYVTMDPYGGITGTSVVKSYKLYGTKQIVDYGTYEKINNMTSADIPAVDGNQVTFDLADTPENDRFYFEGIMDPEVVGKTLPWNISVSYRLNGVERKMEELSGEKGLVEISIDAVPNENASEYYKNNMTLEIAAMVDMDKNLSVEAPGAQIQSVGSMKAVLFMALPGEEQHYELRIGSDDFDFAGLMIMMVPVTLSQLDRLEDLRDARDTVKDSADAISDSLDVLLDSLEGLQGGLGSTVDGLKELDKSRQIISNAKDGIYVDADNALAVLKELSDRGVPFTTYVQDAQNALTDMNKELNNMNDTVQGLSGDLESLGYGLKHVTRDLNDVVDLLSDTRHDVGSYDSKLSALEGDLEDLKEKREVLNEQIAKLKKIIEELKALQKQIAAHGNVLGITPEQKAKLEALLDSIISDIDISSLPPEQQMKVGQLIASCSNAIENAAEDAVNGIAASDLPLKSISGLIKILENLVGTLEKPSKLDKMTASVTQSVATLDDIVERVHSDGESVENVLADLGDVADTLRQSADIGQELLTDVDQLTGVLNTYHDTAVNSLKDAGLLIDSAVRGTSAMYILMSDVESNLKSAGTPLNKGAKLTIEGLSDALNTAIDGLAQTGVIRDAKTTVEDLAEEKWDEYTGEDMTILNADVNAKKLSFTSGENPEPQSLQIILRTEGTDEAEDEAEEVVNEDFKAEGTFFERIWSIIVRIVETIVGIFK